MRTVHRILGLPEGTGGVGSRAGGGRRTDLVAVGLRGTWGEGVLRRLRAAPVSPFDFADVEPGPLPREACGALSLVFMVIGPFPPGSCLPRRADSRIPPDSGGLAISRSARTPDPCS